MKELRRREVPGGQIHAVLRRLRRRTPTRRRSSSPITGARMTAYEIGNGFGHLAVAVPDAGRRVRSGSLGRRQGDAGGRAGAARHDGDRLRRGPGRLQDRIDRTRLIPPPALAWSAAPCGSVSPAWPAPARRRSSHRWPPTCSRPGAGMPVLPALSAKLAGRPPAERCGWRRLGAGIHAHASTRRRIFRRLPPTRRPGPPAPAPSRCLALDAGGGARRVRRRRCRTA